MVCKQSFLRRFAPAVAVLVLLLVQTAFISAQSSSREGVYYGGSVVGGVEVDVEGVLKTAPKKSMEDVGRVLNRLLEPIPDDLNQAAPIRKISLKKLDAGMKEVIDRRGEFPDTIRYLGGLTAIRHIIVVPEENDLLLIGPAEGWKVDAQGNVIGKTSGRPVLRLEDLVTIFRAWQLAERPSVITCSIDPTPEALAKIAQVDRQFAGATAQHAQVIADAYEQAYGRNIVTVQGVPTNSRFAKILVAADYKMKRIGLGQESSMVRGLPSYTSLIRGSRQQINPRFWLAPEYGIVVHDSKKRVWRLSEVKVKALTEDEYVDSRSGARRSTGKPDPAAVAWCGKMTSNYDTLSKIDPVFGDLKNCMELAFAVALIKREGLLEKAGCKLSTFADETTLKLEYPVPKFVPSQATITLIGRKPVIACGGVEINPFMTLEKSSLDVKIDAQYENLAKTVGDAWWSK